MAVTEKPISVERVQLGVRMEKKMVQVLKGLAEFQGVTLGESIDPVTREIGAPRLEQDVHVGPGAVLLGPIVVGSRSKLMANVVLDRSVPADSIVRSPVPDVSGRRSAPADSAPADAGSLDAGSLDAGSLDAGRVATTEGSSIQKSGKT